MVSFFSLTTGSGSATSEGAAVAFLLSLNIRFHFLPITILLCIGIIINSIKTKKRKSQKFTGEKIWEIDILRFLISKAKSPPAETGKLFNLSSG